MRHQTFWPRAETRSSCTREWFPVLVFVLIVCALFGFCFRPEIEAALRVWSESTAYNHCFLVLPMTALLLWNRREVFAFSGPNPAPWALLLVIVLSGAWLLAALVDILEAEQLVVVALFEALLLTIIGWRAFRALMAPLLFLFFLVPFGAFLTPGLQRITAAFAIAGLWLFQIPMFAEGLIIQIPEGSFEIAEACAGLRFLVASIVFGCFFATIMYRSPARRAAFVLLSAALPVLANGMRALGLILLAHLEGSASAALADHILYGWIFFTLVTLLLIAIGMTFTDGSDGVAQPKAAASSKPELSPKLPMIVTMAIGLLIVVLSPAYLIGMERNALRRMGPESLRLQPQSAWTTDSRGELDWRPEVDGASQQSRQLYTNGPEKVVQFTAVYPVPARGSLLTRIRDNLIEPGGWQVERTGRVNAVIRGQTIAVNSLEIVRNGSHRVVWWFYSIGDHLTGSVFDAKFLQARTVLERGSDFGALIAISSEVTPGADPSAVLAHFMSELGPPVRPAVLRLHNRPAA